MRAARGRVMRARGTADTESLLALAGALLDESLDMDAQLNALAGIVLPQLAECCAIYLLDEDDVARLAAVRGPDTFDGLATRVQADALHALLDSQPVSLAQAYGVGAVLSSGAAQLLTDPVAVRGTLRSAESADPHADGVVAALRSSLTLPMLGHGRVVGAVWLGRTRPENWTGDECRLAEAIVQAASMAVSTAQTHGRVLADRQLLIDLQRITAGLAEVASVGEVANVVVGQARAAIGADSAVMATRTDDGLDVLAVNGVPEQAMREWHELTRQGLTPASKALALGLPVFLANRDELAEQYPEAARVLPGEARATLPLLRRGRALGVVRFDWNSPRRFSQSDREFLLSVAQQAASSLERAALLAVEQEARATAEASRRRADLLAEITHSLAASLDVDAVLSRLATLVVPRLADLCTVDLVENPGEPARLLSLAAVTPRLEELLKLTDEYLPRRRNPNTMIGRMLASGETALAPQVSTEHLRRISRTDEQLQMYLKMDLVSGCVVPLRARGQVLGALSMFTTGISGRVYDESDAELMTEVGRRAGLSVDNALLFTREHEAAETLQRSLLPELPNLPGLDAAARYLPAAAHAGVGGDLFDLFALPDGATAIAIGDVMGHDMRAAAAMGQLRSVLRSYAWEGAPPGVVLDRMDLLVQNFKMAQLATAVYARLESDPADVAANRAGGAAGGGARVLRYANAGHLPPLLQHPDGSVRLLEEGHSVLIGAPGGHPRSEAVEPMPTGSTLLLYTDGLIELRRRSIDAGIEELLSVVQRHDPAAGAEALCAAVVASIGDHELIDDVALLAVRLL